jgi:hypothetical protein
MLNILDTPTIDHILSYLPLDDIIKTESIVGNRSDYFWRNYCHELHLNLHSKFDDWRKLAIRVNDILNIFKKHRLIVSLETIQRYIDSSYTIENINKSISDTFPKQDNEYRFMTTGVISLPRKISDMTRNIFYDVTSKQISVISRLCSIDTVYYTPKGIVLYPYNLDLARSIYLYHTGSKFNPLKEAIFIKQVYDLKSFVLHF